MANVRVDMLQIRKADNTVLAATHGRGLFTMTWDVTTGLTEKPTHVPSVFPNPSTGQIQVSATLEQSGMVNLTVVDLFGKQVCHETVAASAGKFNKQINLTGQPKGTYIVALQTGNMKVLNQKIILY